MTRERFFFKNYGENEAGKLVPDHFFLKKKALNEGNANGLQLSFNIFASPSIWDTIKTNYIKV